MTIKYLSLGFSCMIAVLMVIMSSRDENNLLFYLQVNEKGVEVYENLKKRKSNLSEMSQKEPIKDIELQIVNLPKKDFLLEEEYDHLGVVIKKLITRASVETWLSYRFAFFSACFTGWIFGSIHCLVMTFIVVIFLYFFDTAVKHEIH